MDPDYQNPFTQQWNAGYAWQLNSYSALEFDYTHILGLHESKTININPTLFMFLNSAGAEISARPLTAALTAAHQPILGRIDLEQSSGRSRYDGLNVSYRRRLHKGLTVNATYTLSRALAYNGNSAAFRNRAWDPFNFFAPYEIGPTPNDSRHRFSMGSVLNLPAGFQVAPILQWESARPYTAGYGAAVDILGVGGGRGTSHVTVFKDKPSDLTATLTAFGDPGASGAVGSANRVKFRDCLRSGQCTFAAFDTLRGQPFFQLDARLTKNFKIRERANLQAIFQVFDLTNRANFGNNFNTDVRQTNFATPSNFITPSGVTVPHSLSAEIGVRFSF